MAQINFNLGGKQNNPAPQQNPNNSGQPSSPMGPPPVPTGNNPQQMPNLNGMPQQGGMPQQMPNGNNMAQQTGGMPPVMPANNMQGNPSDNPMNQPIQENSTPFDNEEKLDNNKGVKKKGKRKKRNKKKNTNENVKIDEEYIAQEYRRFKLRKIAVFWGLLIGIFLLVGFGVYNTFFTEKFTADNAVVANINYSNQYNNQQWDSGLQSYLQANLHDLVAKIFAQTGTSKKFSVDNISIERNQPIPKGGSGVTSDLFACWFSADLMPLGGETQRVFFELPIRVDSEGYHAAGELAITSNKAYSSNGAEMELADELKFDENKKDEEASKRFKDTVHNFFLLAYNSPEHNVSDFYTGTRKLDFNGKGTYDSISKCTVYKDDGKNKLGFNAEVEYYIILNNGIKLKNHAYMIIEPSGDKYKISNIW